MQIVEWYFMKGDLRGLACSLEISQWANLNVFYVNVTCLTGAQRRQTVGGLIEKKKKM